MGRDRTGSFKRTDRGLFARVTWIDSHGKRRERQRKTISGTTREARRLISEMLEEIDQQVVTRTVDGSAMTFKQLADHYEHEYAIPAQYDKHGIKKAGLRSYKDIKRKLEMLRSHFHGRVRDISYGDIAAFKRLRLNTPVEIRRRVKGRRAKKAPVTYASEYHPREISTVHRELATLRRLFSVAVQHKWIQRNPFQDGDPLINIEEEVPRETIATRDERDALLAACNGEREHLRAVLLLAFDTGFRGSEIYRLRVSDVNLADNCIRAVSYKGKRRRERQFDMTQRLAKELTALCKGKEPNDPLLTYKGRELKSIKRSFKTAKGIAGMADANFRLHDARHTAATRLISRGLSLSVTGKLLGHTQPKTTWRYMHADKATQKRAAELLEEDEV